MSLKVAYLAPELPSLSTTFIYNEILQLMAFDVEVIPFSVHIPFTQVNDDRLAEIKRNVTTIYSASKLDVIKEHFYFLTKSPRKYLQTLIFLLADISETGILKRNSAGLVYRFFYSVYLAKKLLDSNAQHLHVHFAHVPTDLAMYACSLIGIEYSVTAHANDLFDQAWLLKTKVERSGFFVTISEYNKNYLISLGADSDKLKVIRCGVPEEMLNYPTVLNRPKNVVGLVSRLVEKKGIETLIKAMSILNLSGVDFSLIIHGEGPLKAELMNLSRSEGIEDKVEFRGEISHSKVPDFIRSLSVFVLPCRRDKKGDIDGIPVVLMESMALRVPVVSTMVSGIPELIEDGKTGLLCQPEDHKALANKIKVVFEGNLDIDMLLDNAKAKIRNEYLISTNTHRLHNFMIDFFEKLSRK